MEKTLWEWYAKTSLTEFFWSLFIKDYEYKLASAKQTHRMIVDSTNGSINHFYNKDGEQIRGFYKRPARFSNVLPTHPLVVKYK